MPLKPPCELIVAKIIPAFRASIVNKLADEHGMNQTAIAKLLGITQPAVSHYRSKTRGEFEEVASLFPEIEEYSKEIAEKIANEEMTAEDVDLCTPCRAIQESEDFCALHKGFSGLPGGCDICVDKRV